MALKKTNTLLPPTFRTTTNSKFLNATLDQLVTDPDLKQSNGYIGRKFAPGFKGIDTYIKEPTALRADYQLEPSVIYRNRVSDEVEYISTYPEILQKLNYYGGDVRNQNNLWSNEYYTFNPHIDYDKFINFGQYYWVENGPLAVSVYSGQAVLNQLFTITRQPTTGNYNIFGYGPTLNPDLVLVRGGNYTFNINQTGYDFYLQTEPGLSGYQLSSPNISTRNILGVTNNGTSAGTITFNVPTKSAQDYYINMPYAGTVDLATNLRYSQLENQLLSNIVQNFAGIDGIQSNLNGKYLIFTNYYPDDPSWTSGMTTVPENQRYGIWQITLTPSGSDFIINLSYSSAIPANNKVKINLGVDFANTEWFKNPQTYLQLVPPITANLDYLYYQDANSLTGVGRIRLVDYNENNPNGINVDEDILGKQSYTSPNGIIFTNGLKITFDNSVTPESYQNKTYYVDGVGDSIVLIDIDLLNFNENTDISSPDFLTINRASRDLNAWSRRNRWFNYAVLQAAAVYNNVSLDLSSATKATRPIIEFKSNLQLFNFGKKGIAPVDHYDIVFTDPLSEVVGKTYAYVDGYELLSGDRVIFSKATDLQVRNKVYVVSFINLDDTEPTIILTAEDVILDQNTVYVEKGTLHGDKTFYFNGSIWASGQQKLETNQAPYFDVINQQGYSYGNRDLYPLANDTNAFNGTKIFGYAPSQYSTPDPVLGFPISYKSINNIGDIQFYNFFDNQIFEYLDNNTGTRQKINLGNLVQNNVDDTITRLSVWTTVDIQSRQYQIFAFNYDGINNNFVLDVQPKSSTNQPSVRVYVNFEKLAEKDYNIFLLPNNNTSITINKSLNDNDRINVEIYSDQISKLGFYEIPDNLNFNASNALLETITLGSIRNHVQNITESSSQFLGNFPGVSNLRDLNIANKGGTILQQSAPVVYSGLFLNNSEYNFVDSVINAQQEYSRFKNKFLTTATTISDLDQSDIIGSVDRILSQINIIKDNTFPWYYSDMIPYGINKKTLTYTVFDRFQRNYEITNIFSLENPSNQAILIYLNNQQLNYGTDYTFLSSAPAVVFADQLILEEDDIITIVEYSDTDGCYVPETPTKLGLYPKFIPQIITDNTYLNSQQFVKGHDGSLTPLFNDFRDDLLLELEKRIYNNIKVDYTGQTIDVYDIIPGKFRDSPVSLNIFNLIIARSYLQWSGLNNLNYVENDIFDKANPFTFNYSALVDVLNGDYLQGSWRACYQYFYDCQEPNVRPWEMLGFVNEPDWWQTIYGPAPYTAGNQILWQDLEAGLIREGSRQGYDTKFARPGLSSIIPVDVYGNLKPPMGLLTVDFDTTSIDKKWGIGQISPTELAWRTSSEYPYALQIAYGIINPAKYFSFGANTNKYKFNTELNQYLVTDTNYRLRPIDLEVNGYVNTNNTIRRAAGYINWIGDFLASKGIVSKLNLQNYINYFDVNLVYKAAGFTSKEYVKILAEQFSPESINTSIIVPDNDFDIVLHKSAPLLNARYSGVIIEKTESGYIVNGYDTKNPYFTIIVPDYNGKSDLVAILKNSVTWYTDRTNTVVKINYGTEFTTNQQMGNFLNGYQKFLESQGFNFTTFDNQLEQVRDFKLSLKEFLFWEQQGWGVGSTIVLSPYADILTFQTANTIVDEITGSYYGNRVLNQNFLTLDTDSYSVLRNETAFRLSLDNTSSDLIGLADLNLVQYEHCLVFKNKTSFNDVIYEPATGSRQYRLKFVGLKTNGWNGTLYAPGFVYSNSKVDQWQINTDYLKGDLVDYKNQYYSAINNIAGSTTFNLKQWLPVNKNNIRSGLIKNFATNSVLSEDFYNVNNVNLEDQFDKFSLGLIGYREREYLTNAGLNDGSQVKFYQGFIKQKGTKNSIDAVQNIRLNDEDKSVTIAEEWAFRVGSYGSLETNQFIELILDEDVVLNNPNSLEVFANNSITYSSLHNKLNAVYKTASNPWNLPIFLNRTNDSSYTDDIQTAGYINIDDVDHTVFDLQNPIEILNRFDQFGVGQNLWVAKDFSSQWNVYRIFNSNNNSQVINVTKETESLIRIVTDQQHGLIIDDIIILQISEYPEFNGLYKISSVDNLYSFLAESTQNILNVRNFTSHNTLGQLYILRSVRVDYASQIASFVNSDTTWTANSKVWVNYNNDQNEWAVYNKSYPWTSNLSLSVLLNQANAKLGSSLSITADNTFLVAGQPGYGGNVGSVATYIINNSNNIIENLVLTSTVDSTVEMGHSVASGNVVFVTGSPLSNNGKGYVFVYDKDFLGAIDFQQILAANTSNTANYGQSVAISTDDQWLYVGAPGEDKVYAYQFKSNISEEVDVILGDGTTTSFVLGFTPESPINLFISNTSGSVVRNLVPYKEFDVTGSTINFTSAPAAGYIVIRQFPGYILSNVISSANSNIRFGESIDCTNDGRQVIIGAPYANLVTGSGTYSNVGRVDIYDRSIQNFIANGIQTSFTTLDTIKSTSIVENNGIISNSYSITAANTITFSDAPIAGNLISIETNDFKLLQQLYASDASSHSNVDVKFGQSVTICSNNCSLYVGSPNYSLSASTPYLGAVYAYLNQGRVYGSITSDSNVTVTPGNSLRINDFLVTFNGSNVNSVVNSINSANIPGVTAANVDNAVVITSNSTISTNKLRILPGQGNVISSLGLDVFDETQKIINPENKPYDYFGTKVKVSNYDTGVLIVGSEDATTQEYTTFDRYTWFGTSLIANVGTLTGEQIIELKQSINAPIETSFDGGSTKFRDYVVGSGAVWIYNYLSNSQNSINEPGQMAFNQHVIPRFANGASALGNGIKFGSDFVFTNGLGLIGAEYEDTIQTTGTSTIIKQKSGKIYRFNNLNNRRGWDVLREEEPKVDIDSIIKAYVYSINSDTIQYNLDYIDPAKGKILGVAEQDITYKTDYDPAVYNYGSNQETTIDNVFYWSTNQVGEVWWDLSSLRYIEYEQGSIKYRNSNWGRLFPGSTVDVYEWVESLYPPSQYNFSGGIGIPKNADDSAYSAITYVDPGTNTPTVKYYFWVKNKTTVDVNKVGRNLPVASIANYIRDPKSSGIQFFAAIRNDSVSIYNSNFNLSGKDKILHIDYQTAINNNIIHNEFQLISEAAKNKNQIPNNVFNKMIDSLSRIDKDGNTVPDPALSVQTRYGIELRPRQSVFVNQNKAVKEMTEYVNSVFKKYLMSQGFDLTILQSQDPEPVAGSGQYNIKVDNYTELEYLNIAIYPVGFKVLVASDSNAAGLWTIYTKKSNNTWRLTKVQTYDVEEYWEYTDWYIAGYNQTTKPTYTVESIVDLVNLTLKTEDIVKINNNGQGKWTIIQIYPTFTITLGIQDGTIKLKDNLYDLENNFMGFSNERFSVDRFDKNPSIELRRILTAIQDNLFVNQLSQEFVNLFFVLVKYAHNEQQALDWVFKTSFITINQVVKNLSQPKIYYRENQNLYQSYIEEVKPYRTTIREFVKSYDINDNLMGYVTDFDVPSTFDPVLQIYRSPSGEYNQDRDLLTQPQYYDWNQNHYYFVGNISVQDGGSGYTIAPNITITGSLINDNARATAVITGGVVSSVVVTYPGSYYYTQPNVTLSGGNGVGAKIYAQLENNTIRKIKTTLVYDRVTYDSQVEIWRPNTAYFAGNTIAYDNKAYTVTTDFVSGSSFVGNYLEQVYANSFSQANDRIQAFYDPTTGMPGKNFSLLETGIEYPGVTVEGLKFNESGGFDSINFDMATFDPIEFNSEGTPITPTSILDTVIESSYTDSQLTSRDGAIIIDGAEYVDTYSSHAPEELIPGKVFDTLNMTVTTFATDATSPAYSSWVSTTAFYVDSIEILDSGFGYDIGDLVISITGGGGSGATASATLDSNGNIVLINVDSPGIGYTSIPNVIITGSNISVASAYVRLAQNTYDTFSYRIFVDKNETYQYLRSQQSTMTNLAADLSQTATSMIVDDSSRLPVPSIDPKLVCSVVINGERIIYRTKDDTTNTLGQLIRGTYGTGARDHFTGNVAIDAGYDQLIPYGQTYTWTPNVDTAIFGLDSNLYEFYAGNTYVRSNAWIGVGTIDYIMTENLLILNTEAGEDMVTELSSAADVTGLYDSSKTPAVFIRQT